MTKEKNRCVSRFVAAVLGLASILAFQGTATTASAGDNSGNTMIKVMGTVVAPDSGLEAGGDDVLHVSSTDVPTLWITYFLTKNIALETFCCVTQPSISNRVPGLLGLGAGSDIADTWILPPALSLQYHAQMGAFKPYVGVGVMYFHFFDETSYTPVGAIDLKDDWALLLGAGVDVAVGGGWQLSLDIKKAVGAETKIYAGGAYIDTAELNPWLIGVGVGYRFNIGDLFGH